MAYELPYIAAVLLSSALGAAVSLWLYDDDDAVSTRLFAGLLALHSVVGVLVVGQLLAPEPLAVPLYGVQKAVAAGIMPLWFLFALAYTRRRHGLTRPALSVIGGYYLLVGLLELTNPLHRLLRSSYETVGGPITHLWGTPTVLYSLLTLPLALFYFGGLSMVGVHALSGPAVSRRKSAVLFAGYLPPFVVIVADLYRELPGPADGGLVIVSTVSLAAVAWVVFRRHEYDLLPLARETVFETVADAVIVVDTDLRILDYNDAAAESFPRLDGEEGAALTAHVPALVDDGDDDPFAASFTHEGDDGVRHYDTTVSPLAIGGKTRGYGLVLRDVTESRRHITDLEQQTERLERFASTLSHDIRNPLNVAQGRVELAIQTGDIDHLTAAARAHERISRIIDDMLALAREGRQVDDPEQVRVAEVFRSAWGMTDTRNATMVIEDDADITVYADPTRLQRAFENLIRNAVEHGSTSSQLPADDAVEHGSTNPPPSGEGAPDHEPTAADGSDARTDGDDASALDGDVTVTLGRHSGGFYVEDDGPAVPPDERERVFEYEFTTTEEGTGLGLALVDEIARAHGWGVEMADGTEGGARVVFSSVELVGADREPAE